MQLRLYSNRPPVLLSGLVILAREVKRISQSPQTEIVQRVGFHRSFHFCPRFIKPPHRDQVPAVELMHWIVSRVERNGALELLFSPRPVPLILHLDYPQRDMRLSRSVIKL